MEVSELLTRFRLDVRDSVSPYLWSDAEFYQYLDEAQREFCRRTGGIADATSSIARITTVIGTSLYKLSPLILKVRSAFDAEGKKLTLANMEDLEFSDTGGKELFVDMDGPVGSIVLGMGNNQVKLVNTPTTVQVISMIVYRLPRETIEDSDGTLEIDELHHPSLLMWVKHLAHSKSDAETFDRGRADQYEADFLRYCDLARDEKARREHKHRAVTFSW